MDESCFNIFSGEHSVDGPSCTGPQPFRDCVQKYCVSGAAVKIDGI